MKRKATALVTGIAALSLLLTGCQSAPEDTNGSGDQGGTQTVRLGVVGAGDPYWEIYEAAVEAELDIDLQIVNFDKYELPNPALTAGDLDINQFQHIIYLAEHNNETGDDLTPIGSTAIYPLSLHSKKYTSVDDIPAGESIAIPDDASNGARALLVLQQAGLVELKDGGSPYSTVDDVLPESKVTVTPLSADLTVTALEDTAGAVVNNDFVVKAGLNFDDALFQDDPNDANAQAYVNIFVVRAEDTENETYNKLVEIYHDTQDVLDAVQENSGGTAVFLNLSTEQLGTVLADVQKQAAAAKS